VKIICKNKWLAIEIIGDIRNAGGDAVLLGNIEATSEYIVVVPNIPASVKATIKKLQLALNGSYKTDEV
jgi:hypothetical protein